MPVETASTLSTRTLYQPSIATLSRENILLHEEYDTYILYLKRLDSLEKLGKARDPTLK